MPSQQFLFSPPESRILHRALPKIQFIFYTFDEEVFLEEVFWGGGKISKYLKTKNIKEKPEKFLIFSDLYVQIANYSKTMISPLTKIIEFVKISLFSTPKKNDRLEYLRPIFFLFLKTHFVKFLNDFFMCRKLSVMSTRWLKNLLYPNFQKNLT